MLAALVRDGLLKVRRQWHEANPAQLPEHARRQVQALRSSDETATPRWCDSIVHENPVPERSECRWQGDFDQRRALGPSHRHEGHGRSDVE
jgi:hypothetical protein